MKRALATAIGICLTWALFLGASGDVGISPSLSRNVGMSNDLASAMGGSYSGVVYGDPILVVLTLNTNYTDSLKTGFGRFDKAYGIGEVDSTVSKVTGWQLNDDTDYGIGNTRIRLSGSSIGDWSITPDGRSGLTYLNTSLITELPGAIVEYAELRVMIPLYANDFNLSSADTLMFHGVTASDLQDWWLGSNITSWKYINRFTSTAWPTRHGGTDQSYYGRWYDWQASDASWTPFAYTDTTLTDDTWIEFQQTKYLQWLADNPSESYNARAIFVDNSTSRALHSTLATGGSEFRAALVIRLRPLK